MNPIDELKEEHNGIKLSLKIFDRMRVEIEKTGTVAHPEEIEKLLEFFSVFVDRCHHGKEEELLFPAMEALGVSNAGGPIGVMLGEHQQGRDLVKKMKKALSEYKNGQTAYAETLSVSMKTYISLLYQHINKENTVLFTMAAANIKKDKLAELEAGFDMIEKNRPLIN